VRTLGFEVAGYVDADERKLGAKADAFGASVVATQSELLFRVRAGDALPVSAEALVFGIGDNTTRECLWRELQGGSFPTLVHPWSCVSRAARIGQGTVVLAGAIINSDAVVGDAAIINSRAIIEHDCMLSTAVHISPAATLCGGVSVGSASWIGAGAVVIPGRTIGVRCVIGAGAVVVRDVADGRTVIGNPARPLLTHGPMSSGTDFSDEISDSQ
jgi:sugar O-acyltransferase (sialic acid O-acetyltransferase NeuD family)